jgi:hypothetical protein
MKTKIKITNYIIDGIAAAMLVLTAQISLAGSATWLSSPQDSAWENANNWTLGGPPNGPSDIATFAQSSQTHVNISTSEEVNSIVFTSNSASFTLSIPPCFGPGCPNIGSKLTISGTGVTNNNSVLQTFEAGGGGQIVFNNTSTAASAHMRITNYDLTFGIGGRTIFNDTSSAAGASIENASEELGLNGDIGQTIFNGSSTADHASISNYGASASHGQGGQTTFNGTSTAANASIHNWGTQGETGGGGETVFNNTSTAGHATITNDDEFEGGSTVFNDSSTADSAILIANGGTIGGGLGGAILFNGASTGGTARVEVFGPNGYLDIRGHNRGVTIGSIEGSGDVLLGANRLTVGTNGINTAFSGVIQGSGSLAKVGSGVLILQANDCIADTVGLILVSGSIIKLDFTGPPDVIASLVVNGVPQPPGIYGGPMSGAPNILPEFWGLGRVSVGLILTLGNISARAFVQTGGNVMIGGFIITGSGQKRVIVRAIGPSLLNHGISNPLRNPTLELHDHTGAVIAFNDNWMDAPNRQEIMYSGLAPTNNYESAILMNLSPGNYTAIVRGVNNGTGIGLVEGYDLDPTAGSKLGNISTRAPVQTGNNVMIGGFIITGSGQKRVIVRAIGPSLAQHGITNPLLDPTLELHNGNGAVIAFNDNWMDAPNKQEIIDSGLAPSNNLESAILMTLSPGNYTAIVRGVNNTTGVALVEVYDLGQ